VHTPQQRRRSNHLISNINVVGFSSVLLVLLYLLIGPYTAARDLSGHDVDMAKVKHPEEMPDSDRDDAMIITVSKDGRFYWGNDMIESSALAIRIKDRVNQGSPRIVYFKVDARTKYSDVKSALDAVRISGLEKIVFLVEKKKN
jgi:biopolymer transport protein TolR